MYKVSITDDFIVIVKRRLKGKNLGLRSNFNGNDSQQLAGMIGEAYVKQVLNIPFKISDSFDGGYDFTAGRHKIDIKVQVWSGEVKGNYTSTIPLSQIGYTATGYIFCVYDAKVQELTICGAVSKQAVLDWGVLYRCGQTTGFGLCSKINHWGMAYENLKFINTENDLIELVNLMEKGHKIKFY